MKQFFHIGDILSITTHRLVSLRGIDGIYAILNFMTQDNLWTHQLPRATVECRPHLLAQLPWTASSELEEAIQGLDVLLKGIEANEERMQIIGDWLSALASRFGPNHAIEPIPRDDHTSRDPLEEAVEMIGDPKRVIVCNVEKEQL